MGMEMDLFFSEWITESRITEEEGSSQIIVAVILGTTRAIDFFTGSIIFWSWRALMVEPSQNSAGRQAAGHL